MFLTELDVREILAYTRIELVDDEVAPLTDELNAIIANLQPITEYDLQGVEPTYHPIAGLSNVMRDDVAVPGMSRDCALALASVHQDGQYRVPPILGHESQDL